jgi:hypothetical protein
MNSPLAKAIPYGKIPILRREGLIFLYFIPFSSKALLFGIKEMFMIWWIFLFRLSYVTLP